MSRRTVVAAAFSAKPARRSRSISSLGVVSCSIAALLLAAALLFGLPSMAAQEGGGGGGGGGTGGGGGSQTDTHIGDLFGDLIHIKRDPVTGVPIFQKKMIEYPEDIVDWGYCPIPVDVYGLEIPTLDLSCDVDPAHLTRVVEVNYFGRLSGGRTREHVLRMHLDEVITMITEADLVTAEPSGRMMLGTDCTVEGVCAEWKTIDSPMENLALYRWISKYGHLQTDPLEVDADAHGDPAAGTVYHPALSAADYAKFTPFAASLLPRPTGAECFTGETVNPACVERQSLTAADFLAVASFLGGASDKHGKMTFDLIHYLNRILRIPVDTAGTLATLDTLPALVRDEHGVVAPAADGLPAPANERFMDYSDALYFRDDRYARTIPALVNTAAGVWTENLSVSLLPFLTFRNGPMPAALASGVGFLANAADAQRAIEFVHEYAIPVDLTIPGMFTRTTIGPHTAPASLVDQVITLQANVTDTVPVDVGTVTFTLMTPAGVVVGTPTVSGTVTGGVATASYTLPGSTIQTSLIILAAYSGGTGFAASYGTGILTISGAYTTVTVTPANAPLSSTPQSVALTASVVPSSGGPINEGNLTFTVRDGAGAVVGTPVVTPVVNNAATAAYLIPGGLPEQILTITGAYDGTANFLGSAGTAPLMIGVVCTGMITSPDELPILVVGAEYTQPLTSTGVAPVTMTVTGGALPVGVTLVDGVLTGIPETEGEYSVTISTVDALGCTASETYAMLVGKASNFITGSGTGVAATVKMFTMAGVQTGTDLAPYDPSFLSGVRVAMADVNGDGVADTITGASAPGVAQVNVISGWDGSLLRSFTAFEDNPAGGVYVAGGDVDNDGTSDVIVGRGSGAANIKVFNGRTGLLIRAVTAFAGAEVAPDGVRVATTDVNGDGYADIIAGAGPGGASTVEVYDVASGSATLLGSFDAFAPIATGGVFVAGGDVTGDGFGDIVIGSGEGFTPFARVRDGVTFEEVTGIVPFVEGRFTGGVRVAASDLNLDGYAEIIVGAGPGAEPMVKVYDGKTAVLGTEEEVEEEAGPLAAFLAYDAAFTGGVYVAAPVPMPRMNVDIPTHNATVDAVRVAGWAFNESATTGAGVDAVHAWAYPVAGGDPLLVGVATIGLARPDVAAAFGARFLYSGFDLTGTLPAGTYNLVVFVHTDVSDTWNNRRVVTITVR